MDARKAIVVTGATKGLGLAISTLLVAEGYHVAGVARNESKSFSDLREASSGLVDFVACDLSRVENIHGLAQKLQRRLGRVFGLVNNAGIGGDGLLATMHETEIAAMLAVNLHAPILLAKYLCRGMLINRAGRIVNISSIIASTGFSGLSVYGATKAGLVGFTKSLARELGKAQITVNCIAPGYMETDMTDSLIGARLDSIRRRSPLSRFATPGEVAAAVVYLLSDSAAAITGTVLTVDAGSTA
jgi:3-oxoacyl-[acyl-carrier protein] reductase